VDKEAGGQFWWTKRQVASFGGHRDGWPVLVDTETGGQFCWTQRQVASFGGHRDRWPVFVPVLQLPLSVSLHQCTIFIHPSPKLCNVSN